MKISELWGCWICSNVSHLNPRTTVWKKYTERLYFKQVRDLKHQNLVHTAKDLSSSQSSLQSHPLYSPILFVQLPQLCIWFDRISSFIALKPLQILGGNSICSSFYSVCDHWEDHCRSQLLYHIKFPLFLLVHWKGQKQQSAFLLPRKGAQAEVSHGRGEASLYIHCHFLKKKKIKKKSWCQSQSWHNRETSAFH